MDTLTNRAKAYSYVRFSRAEQADGDSFRRKTEAAQAYCARHGLDLADLTFRDLGVSAAAGANAEVGALGQFIDAVESGRVEPGSHLVIEKMDRLSRDKVRQARDRFESLLDAGIVIVTLNPERVYRAESYDLTDMIITLIDMSQSRQFVENLSYRVGEAWRNKRKRAVEDGHKMTMRAPAWLRLRVGEFEIIEERAAIVRRIFQMTLAGHGKGAIARRFNEEGVEPFGDGPSHARKADGWRSSYITKILRNPAVIGTFQPMKRARKFEKERVAAGEAIPGYFPAIVPEADFYAVKQMKPAPSGKKRNPLRNVLSGIAYCAICGGKMHWVNKGPTVKGGQYLACDNARRKGTCDAKSVRYSMVVDEVISTVRGFRVVQPDDNAAKQREREIAGLAGKIEEKTKARDDLYSLAGKPEFQGAIDRLAQLETEIADLKAKRQELQEKAIARVPNSDWEATAKLAYTLGAMSRGELMNDADTVAHIAAELRRMVERVEVQKGKPVKVIPNPDAYETVPKRESPQPIAKKRKTLGSAA